MKTKKECCCNWYYTFVFLCVVIASILNVAHKAYAAQFVLNGSDPANDSGGAVPLQFVYDVNLDKTTYYPNSPVIVSFKSYLLYGTVYTFNGYLNTILNTTVNGQTKELFNGAMEAGYPSRLVNNSVIINTGLNPGNFNVVFIASGDAISPSQSFSLPYVVIPAPVNGTCGSSNGATLDNPPTTNLCSAGFPSVSGQWSWSCFGSNGGSTASCRANVATPPPVYSCSIASPKFSYAREVFQSYNPACFSGSAIGTTSYPRDCAVGPKLFDPYNYASFCVAPTVNISANPNPVSTGSPATISWSTTNASACWATGGWTDWKANTGGSENLFPAADTSYTIECWNAASVSSGQQTVAVGVTCVPNYQNYSCPSMPTGATCDAANAGQTITTQTSFCSRVDANNCSSDPLPTKVDCAANGATCPAYVKTTCPAPLQTGSWREVAPN